MCDAEYESHRFRVEGRTPIKGHPPGKRFAQPTRALLPPPYIFQKRTPRLAYGQQLVPYSALSPLIEIQSIAIGNQGLTVAISRTNTLGLPVPQSLTPTARPSPPRTFLAESFSEMRSSLQLNWDLVQDLSPHARQTVTPCEEYILSIFYATLSGIVAIMTQLDTVTNPFTEVCEENHQLDSSLHELSSRVAKEIATREDIAPLQSALRALSHRVSASAPIARHTVRINPPPRLAAGSHPTPPPEPRGPPAQSAAPTL